MDERKTSSIPVPAGFDLSKYDQCRDLTPKQWVHELERRNNTGLLPRCGDDFWPGQSHINEVLSEVRDILQHPIEFRAVSELYGCPIRDMTVADIQRVNEKKLKRRRPFDENEHDILCDRVTNYIGTTDLGAELLVVDLLISDKILIEKFKQHLKVMRKRNPTTIKKTVTENKIKKLAGYNALAILDLMLIERIYGKPIVRTDMALILGTDYQTLVETRIPFSLEAVSFEFLSDLSHVEGDGRTNIEKN